MGLGVPIGKQPINQRLWVCLLLREGADLGLHVCLPSHFVQDYLFHYYGL